MGNVVSGGVGQAPARQAALKGGLADHVAALTINKVCGSGLKAVMLAHQGIQTGDIDIAVAGGTQELAWFENPSWAKHVIVAGVQGIINVDAVRRRSKMAIPN